jgi:hypothetical protein
MKNAVSVSLAALSAFFLLAFTAACALAPPLSFDSRDVLVWAIGAAGLLLAVIALRELRSTRKLTIRA